jgi:glycosyltransferase involved in cell wall biosynthesis
MSFFRSKGISLLVPTQNVEQTIEPCLRSFKNFPDEMIVVDNGSTDDTIDIVRSLEGEIPNMRFYEAPHLKDLYENRQYAFERSQYEWIVRIDSDYIAYTRGENSITNLRTLILSFKTSIRPKAFGVSMINLMGDKYHMGVPKELLRKSRRSHILPPFNSLAYRIIQWYPGMRFQRNGRWEGVRWQGSKLFDHRIIKTPYWFHCSFKAKKDWFIRYERNNWRELANFERYPTRESYIEEVAVERYGTTDLNLAGELHWKENIEPYLLRYDEEVYLPYPDHLKKTQNA